MSVADLTAAAPAPGAAAALAATAAPAPGLAAAPIVLTRPDPARRRRARIRIPRLARRGAGPLAALALWQLVCSSGVLSPVELASPAAVASAARGLFWLGEDLLDPVIQLARGVPILGLLPLAIIWFGVGEFPKVFLIALGCLFPVYLNTYAAIRGVDGKLAEAGQVFGLGHWGLVRKVILPGALPGFLVGLRFALVASWLTDVVAEEINAQSGLGYLINQAQTTNRTDVMCLCLVLYAIFSLAADGAVRLLERHLLAWRRG